MKDTASAIAHLKNELASRGIDITILDDFVIPSQNENETVDEGTDGGGTGDGGTGDGGTGDGGTGDGGSGDGGTGDGGTGDGGSGDGGSGDGGTGDGDIGGGASPLNISALPAVISNDNEFSTTVTLNGNLEKLITINVTIEKHYASLSLYSGNSLIIDNIDIPAPGTHELQMLVQLQAIGQQELRLVGRSSDITVNSMTIVDMEIDGARFIDSSQDIGLDTEDTLKYGGPSIGDVNNDGYYDFILANHNYVPPQLVTNNGNNTVTVERLFPGAQDFHGNALGDYDNDGDLDIMVAIGGANGTSPTSYVLLKNNDGVFENVSIASGINTPARGRAPRWVDFDLDGDLDVLLVNATTPNSDGPIQLFFRNMGDGTFSPVRVPGVESKASERVLITDFNSDNIDDIILYSPLSLWAGNGDFTFTNVSSTMLPDQVNNVWGINAITDVDVNNDGLLDLYLAFGKTHYQLSRKSIDFNPNSGELNIKDDGETGTTLIDFNAAAEITLSELNLTYRQYDGGFPIFLGDDKTRKVVKATGFQASQLSSEMAGADEELIIAQADANGWPSVRTDNGLYIGYLGDGNWKAEWVRDQNIYWDISFTLAELSSVDYDWVPNNRNGQDVLLINHGDSFVDATNDWNLPKGGDHWGVTPGDFNNDGYNDLYVYRYGFLKERISDLLLLNTGEESFITTHTHGASDGTDPGHGDMGQAFDFDKDGKVDILSGSEEGRWYLWKNDSAENNNYLLVDVGYSPLNNVDSIGATVELTTESGGVYKKRVGSAGEVFSSGVIDTVHFGLGQTTALSSVEVKWRNGERVTLTNIATNGIVTTDNASNPSPNKIDFDDSELRLRQSDSIVLVPNYKPLNAVTGITWTSSDTSVASVDSQGMVSGVSPGTAVVTATSTADTDVVAQITIEVGGFELVAVTDVSITGTEQAFYEGQQVQLNAVISPSDADNQEVTWSSSNEAVATVSTNGLVSNLSTGSSDITVTAQGASSDTVVSDTIGISVEALVAQSVSFDDRAKYTQDILVDDLFEVTVNYHAGSGQVVSDAGIRFYLRELTSAWAPVNDIIVDETSSVGTSSGTATVDFNLSGIKLTSELDEGNFYFLFVQYSNDKGESVDIGLQPLNIIAGGSGDSNVVCDATSNLLGCANTNGENGDSSEWYAYAQDNYSTDLSSEISVSDEQANGGNNSIKFAFNDGGTQQHFILRDASFQVVTAGDFKLDADIFGDNLSSGTDYVIEISFRPADAPQSSETYKLWHRRSAGTWHNLTLTSTLPVGNYIVGFKVFSPGFANTLTLDYYVDNVVVSQL